jgi:hypothetical protein
MQDQPLEKYHNFKYNTSFYIYENLYKIKICNKLCENPGTY